MTLNIESTLSERALLETELSMLEDQLISPQHGPYCQEEMPEDIERGILIRMGVLLNGMEFLDKMIAGDLAAIPLYKFNIDLPVQNARY